MSNYQIQRQGIHPIDPLIRGACLLPPPPTPISSYFTTNNLLLDLPSVLSSHELGKSHKMLACSMLMLLRRVVPGFLRTSFISQANVAPHAVVLWLGELRDGDPDCLGAPSICGRGPLQSPFSGARSCPRQRPLGLGAWSTSRSRCYRSGLLTFVYRRSHLRKP